MCEDKCEGARSECVWDPCESLKAEAAVHTGTRRNQEEGQAAKISAHPPCLDDSELFLETGEPGSRVSRQETAEGCYGPSSSFTYRVTGASFTDRQGCSLLSHLLYPRTQLFISAPMCPWRPTPVISAVQTESPRSPVKMQTSGSRPSPVFLAQFWLVVKVKLFSYV